jgi:hypothetical protein
LDLELAMSTSSSSSDKNENSTELMQAAERGDTATLQALLDKYQDPKGVRHKALMKAINKNLDAIRRLICSGVEITDYHVSKVLIDRMGEEPDGNAILDAFFEASDGKWDINKTMKEHGLLQSCAYSIDSMRWFLDHGMDPNLHGKPQHCFNRVDGQPSTPIDAAVTTEKTDVLDLIHSFGGKMTRAALFYAIFRSGAISAPVVNWLLDHGADSNIEDEEQGSILTFALHKNAKEMIGISLERGADIHKDKICFSRSVQRHGRLCRSGPGHGAEGAAQRRGLGGRFRDHLRLSVSRARGRGAPVQGCHLRGFRHAGYRYSRADVDNGLRTYGLLRRMFHTRHDSALLVGLHHGHADHWVQRFRNGLGRPISVHHQHDRTVRLASSVMGRATMRLQTGGVRIPSQSLHGWSPQVLLRRGQQARTDETTILDCK